MSSMPTNSVEVVTPALRHIAAWIRIGSAPAPAAIIFVKAPLASIIAGASCNSPLSSPSGSLPTPGVGLSLVMRSASSSAVFTVARCPLACRTNTGRVIDTWSSSRLDSRGSCGK